MKFHRTNISSEKKNIQIITSVQRNAFSPGPYARITFKAAHCQWCGGLQRWGMAKADLKERAGRQQRQLSRRPAAGTWPTADGPDARRKKWSRQKHPGNINSIFGLEKVQVGENSPQKSQQGEIPGNKQLLMDFNLPCAVSEHPQKNTMNHWVPFTPPFSRSVSCLTG